MLHAIFLMKYEDSLASASHIPLIPWRIGMQTTHFNIVGMTGVGCANAINRAVSEMGGVRGVHVSFEARDALIHYDERITSPAKVRLAILSAGYDVEAKRVDIAESLSSEF